MSLSNKRLNTPRSICELCHGSFECGKDSKNGCWCDKIPNVMPVPTDTGSCLCPDCLQKKVKEILQKK